MSERVNPSSILYGDTPARTTVTTQITSTDSDGNICYYDQAGEMFKVKVAPDADFHFLVRDPAEGEISHKQRDQSLNGTLIEQTLTGPATLYLRAGILHREHGPALMMPPDTQQYYSNGYYHRADGPAIISGTDGEQWWYQGELHREDGPAVVLPDGSESWYFRGRLHRDRGPAKTVAGRRSYYHHGELLPEQGKLDKEWLLNRG